MADQSAVLRELLQRSQTAISIGSGSWAAVARSFRGHAFDAWADAFASLLAQRLSPALVTSFVAFFVGQAILSSKHYNITLTQPGVLRAVLMA